MVFFNYALRKLNAKIVYYGPGLCGKTTNLQWIHDHFEGGQRGKMISLATEGDRTIFFDLLPIDIGTIRGMDVTLQLYTVPGQVHYNSTRQLVLRGADGVVFVADSQRTMKASNIESFENLQENLMLQGIDLKDFPHILQFNKRDLRDLLSIDDLNESLNVFSVPIFEAIATEGIGVQESLEGIVKLVMRSLREKYEPVASAGGPQPMSASQPSGPVPVQPATPATPPLSPLAPDFVSEPPPPAPQAPTSVAMPGAATEEPPAPPEEPAAAAEEPPPAAADIGEPSFQDEDAIATAVYEASDERIARAEAELVAEAAPEPPAAAATDLSDVVASLDDGGVETDAPEHGVPADHESVDDLFEAEPPTVKAYIEETADVIATEGRAVTDSGEIPLPPSVDAAAAQSSDRYEDRIEAPGPFAPPAPSQETPAGQTPPDEPEPAPEAPDEDRMRDEILQAFGASENREALASLASSDDAAETEAHPVGGDLLEDPPEVQPVTPPPPIDEPAGPDFFDEATPAVFSSAIADEGGGDGAPASFDSDSGPVFGGRSEHDEWVAAEAPAPEEPVAESEMPTVEVTADEPEAEEPEPEMPTIEVTVDEPEAEEPEAEEPKPEMPTIEVTAVKADAEPEAEEAPAAAAHRWLDDPVSRAEPIMVGSGDPFADDAGQAPEVVTGTASVVPAAGAIDVTGQDNQLHLQLKGSGAIAEMGQVRALDIEVPVPGQWVGNRKVTLQLRLTLTPAEDDNG